MFIYRPKKVVLRADKEGCPSIYACSVGHLYDELRNVGVDCTKWKLATTLNQKARRLKSETLECCDMIDGWCIHRTNSTISSRRSNEKILANSKDEQYRISNLAEE